MRLYCIVIWQIIDIDGASPVDNVTDAENWKEDAIELNMGVADRTEYRGAGTGT